MPKPLEFKFSADLEKLATFIKASPTVILTEGANAMYEEAEEIMAASKEIVPVLTGALRASGRVLDPEIVGDTATVTLGYGGFAATEFTPALPSGVAGPVAAPTHQYAIVQHENLTFRHKGGRRAKYLEEPFYAAQSGMEGRLADRIAARLKVK